MRILNPAVDLEAFFDRLGEARDCVLLSDYDGTLAPFHERPECAHPYPAAVAVLEALMEQGSTRVVIVSGRELKDLLPLLPFRRRPEIWGAHGWQRLLAAGQLIERSARRATRDRLDEAARQARDELEHAGVRLECKAASVALHWRGLSAEAIAEVRSAAARAWQPLADGESIELLEFDGGLELRAVGHDKGDAVRTALSESSGDCVVAYLGDDATDEDAFAAVKPRGLAVLVRDEPRATCADLWLRAPEELVTFLERWRERRGERT